MSGNLAHEEKKASFQELSFKTLGESLKEKVGITNISFDILKILNLCNKEGFYNIAGELLADENDIEASRIDLVRYGQDRNQVLYRESLTNKSLLDQYDRVIEIFKQYYQYEEIKEEGSVKKELIPIGAFKELLSNAMVHRAWDVNSPIQISMYKDRIEMNSPGGLPEGINEEEYLYRDICILRNPIIADVFSSLGLIKRRGSGIKRISQEYSNSFTKPFFDVGKSNVFTRLPLLEKDKLYLSEAESHIYYILKEEIELSRIELDKKAGFNKYKTIRTLNKLVDKGTIRKLGDGPGTTYRLR